MGKDSKKKKLGTVEKGKIPTDIPLWDRLMNHKEYVIVGFLVIALILMYFLIFKNLGRNPALEDSAEPSPTALADPTHGELEVTSDPEGAVIQFFSQRKRTPITFENIPEGEYVVISSLPDYRNREDRVEIKPGETTKLHVILQK